MQAIPIEATMSRKTSSPSIPLPKNWSGHVKSAMLHVMALAQCAITYTRGWAADSVNTRVRQAAEIDQLRQEVLLQKEENRIKDVRMALIDPRHRPHYPPPERLATHGKKRILLNDDQRRRLAVKAKVRSWDVSFGSKWRRSSRPIRFCVGTVV